MIVPRKIEVIARIVDVHVDYPGCIQIRCPFCDQIHEHHVSRRESLLGVPIHRLAHCCNLDYAHHYRGQRRKRLEEGKALHEAAGGAYYIPLTDAVVEVCE